MAEVFLDTFVICTITGLVLGVTGVLDSGAPGNVLAINAFASVWEPLRYVVAVCLLMFSSTTLMSQWYFGFVGLNYIFGTKVPINSSTCFHASASSEHWRRSNWYGSFRM